MSAADLQSRPSLPDAGYGGLRLERGARLWAAVAGLTALVVALYAASFLGIARLWTLSAYNHCFLVFPLAFYLLWQRRGRLASVPVMPSLLGFILLGGLVAAWYAGRAISLQALEHAAAIAIIPAVVLAVMGTRFFRAALLPLGFLLLAIPVGEVLIPILMRVTADVASALLGIVGIPAYRQGQFISLSGGDFEIADVCSGLKYLLASVPLALLYAYWTFRGALKRTVFVLVTALAFVVGNGIRAFAVMTVASATEMRYFVGEDHVIFGMGLFVLLLGFMCWLGWKYADPPLPEPEATPWNPPAGHARRSILAGAAAVALLALGSNAQALRTPPASAAPATPILPAIAGCTSPEDWAGPWAPVLRASGAEVRATYRCGHIQTHILIATYDGSERGRELASSGNVLVPELWWTSGSRIDAESGAGDRRLAVNEVTMPGAERSLFAWYWYSVNDTSTRTLRGVKLHEGLAAMLRRPTVSRAYVVAATGPRDEIEAMRRRVSETADAVWHAREGSAP